MKAQVLIPVITAVLIVIFTAIFTTCWEKISTFIFPGRTLVHIVSETPETIYLNTKYEKMKLSVNNYPISTLYKYRIRIRNEGSKEVRNLPAIIQFEKSNPPFLVFGNTRIDSIRFQVDSIRLQKTDSTRFQIKIGLLIPHEVDTFDFITNHMVQYQVEAKGSGVTIKTSNFNWPQNTLIICGKKIPFLPSILALSFCFFFLGIFYSFLMDRKKTKPGTKQDTDVPYDDEDRKFDNQNTKKIKDAARDITYNGD